MVHTSSEFKDLRTTRFKQLNPGCQLRKIYFAIKDAARAAQVSALAGRAVASSGCSCTVGVTVRKPYASLPDGRAPALPRVIISDCPFNKYSDEEKHHDEE